MVEITTCLPRLVIFTSLFLFFCITSRLLCPRCLSISSVLTVCGGLLAGLIPFVFFAYWFRDSSGKITACGLLLFVLGYALLGLSLLDDGCNEFAEE